MNGEELKMYHDGDETLAVAEEESTKKKVRCGFN